MDEQRLKAFEDMHAAILKQYDDTTKRWRSSKPRARRNRYLWLFANKLQLQAMLVYYKTYGLLDKVK